MSQWVKLSCCLGACFVLMLGEASANADGPFGNPYPRVIGATGRPYGPTRAHYEYQRQYGHPWGGSNPMYGGAGVVGGYPGSFGYGGVGYSLPAYGCYGSGPVVYGAPFGVAYSSQSWSSFGWGLGGYSSAGFYSSGYSAYPPLVYPATAPVRLPTQDGWPGPQVWDVLHQQEQGLIDNDLVQRPWNDPQPQQPIDQLQFLPPSTPEALIESQGRQDQGDQHFQQFRMASATESFREAVAIAPERPEPYFRLAVTLAARRKFIEAVNVLQQLLAVDPNWPSHGTPLGDMFRLGDELPKTEIKQRVADWVLQDVRDADRLFLLGVLLYFDDDRENAVTLLETAALIEGNAGHLAPFLNPIQQVGGQVIDVAPTPAIEFVPDVQPLIEPAEGPRFGPEF